MHLYMSVKNTVYSDTVSEHAAISHHIQRDSCRGGSGLLGLLGLLYNTGEEWAAVAQIAENINAGTDIFIIRKHF